MNHSCCIYFLVVYLIVSVCSYDVSVSGSTSFLAAFNRFTSAYSHVKPTTRFTFIPGSAPGAITLIKTGNVTAAYSDVTIDELFKATNDSNYHNYITIPAYAQPFTWVYNIPEVRDNSLVFNYDIFAQICTGKILRWNDPALVVLNPQLSNVDKPIIRVIRNSGSAVVLLITTLMMQNSKYWTSGSMVTFPADNITNTIRTDPHVFSIFSQVFSNDYSLALEPFTIFATMGFDKGVNYAGFRYEDGTIYWPNDTTAIKTAIEEALWTGENPGYGIKINSRWPMTIMGNLILPINSENLDCDAFKEVLRFARWCYTNPEILFVIERAGYYLPSDRSIDHIKDYLDKKICGGKGVLQVEPVQLYGNTAKIVITAIYWVILSGLIIGTLPKMKLDKRIAKIYMCILILGLLLCGTSLIFWSIEPISNSICIARWWLMGLGMVIFSGGVFCRIYQLKKIHQLMKTGRYGASKNYNHMKLLSVMMGVIIFIEVIILLILQFSSPLETKISMYDPINRLGTYKCDNSVKHLWLVIQSCYLVCILALGVYAMYSTWGISSSVDDTRVNVLVIFMCLITLGVTDTVVAFSDQSEIAYSWWAISLIVVWSLSMMLSVLVPRMIKAISKKSSSESRSTRPSGSNTKTQVES